jgi:uncharacterized membrane protein
MRTYDNRENIQSTAAVAGHPIHPMLVAFPLAFFYGVLGTDLGYIWTHDFFWDRASLWLAGVGLITGLLAGGVGLIDFLTIRRARAHKDGWIHVIGNVTALFLTLISLLLRWNDPTAVSPWRLVLSGLVAVIVTVTAWYGTELSHRYKIAMIEQR